MKNVIAGLIAALFASASATAQDQSAIAAVPAVELSGAIDLSFDTIGTRGIDVRVNGELVELRPDGSFTAAVKLAPYYRITAEGEGIYSAIQTFGVEEIYRAQCECLEAPAVAVVARKPGRVGLFFAGDAMAGRRYVEPIWGERQLVDPADPLPDMRKLLEPMRPYIESADLASANLEIVLSQRDFGNSPPKSVVFFAHPALAQALKEAGFDYVSLGNNHSYDYLEEGLVTTIAAVEAAGLAWSGAGHDEEQALRSARLSAANADLCLLGYVGWKGRVEPNQVAEAGKGGAAYGSDDNIASSVARDAQSGCAVIAQYHGSREYSEGPTEESERRMKLAVDKGAALVASHHPHVAHGLELYKDSLIAYSLGNFLFDQYFIETHGAFALNAWLDHGRFVRAEIIPLRVLDYRPVPAVGSMREAVLQRIARLSAERATKLIRSGGHGVIVPDALSAVEPAQAKDICPATRDLFRAGDFENAAFDGAVDRTLKAEGGSLIYEFAGLGGHFLKLRSDQGASDLSLLPSTFFRVVPGNRITVSGKLRLRDDVQLTVSTQHRPQAIGRFEALETAPFLDRGSRDIRGDGEWQDFALSFVIEESEGSRPFRPRLKFSGNADLAGRDLVIELDDLRIAAELQEPCELSSAP